MAMDTTHTFAILAYKQSPYLEDCIESLQRQTVKSKIILSTSTPSGFLDQLARRHNIDMIHNKNDGGIGADWTFAYDSADTQFVTLAHQDDIYYQDYTESCLLATRRTPEFLISFTDYDELYGNSFRRHTLNMAIKKSILAGFYFLNQGVRSRFSRQCMLSLGSPISCPSVMYNRKAIGRFAFASDMLVSLDWEAWLQLSQREGTFVYVRRPLMAHRVHPESQTSLCIDNDQRKNEDQILFERIWPKPIARMIASLYTWSYRSNA